MLHDWGCIFGYELAMRHPQRVEAVVAIDIGDHNATGVSPVLVAETENWPVAAYQLWLAKAWMVGRYLHPGTGQPDDALDGRPDALPGAGPSSSAGP